MGFIDPIAYSVPAFIILMIAEGVAARARSVKGYEFKDTVTSLSMGIGSLVVSIAFGTAVAYATLRWIHEFRIINEIPVTWWSVALCYLAYDFAYYWKHRLGHEHRWFWASHVNHHSSQFYNLSTALRQTWTGEIAFAFVFGMPVALIGFSPEMVYFVAALNLVYQFWIHTELIDRMGPLEWVLNTPSHHRVHHAANPRYLDANYGGTLIIWDRMFGTFTAEEREEPVRYGIGKPLESNNIFFVAFHEWMAMARDMKKVRSLKELVGYTFGVPGWTPDGSRITSKMAKDNWKRRQEKKRQAESNAEELHREDEPVS
ncbi:sterol desaturase family protein [Rhodobacteraceae bacterium RKSG542]|uniref:sterol desaturase family protein n=1 Tax=Pseudovibrio flavus TaxID=2529854 RepID=UPI0012BCF932|nr:sterol desaturase family protein [Pseudovibrio flavus]MTI18351.1 sterol desaturase family protein [Pseudovibrio flavus]